MARKKVIIKLEDLSYAQLFALLGKRAAIRSLINLAICAVLYFILTGQALTPYFAVGLLLFDASLNTWKSKLIKAFRKDDK